MEDEYVSVDDAARLLGRSRATAWNLIRRHKIQTFKRPMDRKTYVLRADILRLPSAFEPRGETNAAA